MIIDLLEVMTTSLGLVAAQANIRVRMLTPEGTAGGKVGHRQTPYKQKTLSSRWGFFVLREQIF